MPRITKRTVDALKPGDRPIWDSEVKGFGVRVSKKGRKTYVVTYRPKPGGRGAPKRWYVIGVHGSPETVDSARTEAKRILGLAAAGKDPQAEEGHPHLEVRLGCLQHRRLQQRMVDGEPLASAGEGEHK